MREGMSGGVEMVSDGQSIVVRFEYDHRNGISRHLKAVL